MIRRPPRSTLSSSSAASDVYKRQIEGRVVVKFIVRSTGEIGDVKVLRSIREDLDKECLRVMSTMPNWKPGMISGNPVAVSYSIHVRFLLQPGENLNGIYICLLYKSD